MDDPWGSPWTTSDNPSRNEFLQPPSPPRALLSPPPKAFVGSASASPAQSPWVDDGGFGDWTGTDSTQNKKNQNLTDWGVWGDPSSLQQPQSTSRHDGSGRASPLAWPSSAATSPGLKPLPRSRTSSIFRQPSPDPWAAEFSFRNRRDTFSSFSLSVHEDTGSKPDNLSGEVTHTSHLGTELGKNGMAKKEDKSEDKTTTDIDKHESNQPHVSPIITTPQDPAGPATKSVINETHEISPRPSSTFSHPSSQEIDRQDSPITSIDEDSKSRLQPIISRKTSGKVHELVGMYDDLTPTTIEERPPTEGRGTTRRIDGTESSSGVDKPPEEDKDPADFGDFEDVAQGGEAIGPTSAPIIAQSGRPSTPRGHARDSSILQTSTLKSPEAPSPGTKATTAAIGQLIEKFGPIQFDVDLNAVDKLFPPAVDEPHKEAAREHAEEVPDRLITDSFTSISERKAWYRISRYGSKRKHDLGDDENYHRVTWSNSEMRTDTLKIVRRWMEEDSYAGRAILGGSKRTSVFNWDSTAAPVDLNTVFRRKSLHSRTSSVQQQQSRQSTTSSVHSTVGPPSASVTAATSRASTSSRHTSEVPSTPVVAGFGWSSSTISESPNKVDAAATTGKPRHSIDPPPPPLPSPQLSRPSPAPVASRAKAPSPVQPPKPQPQTSKVNTNTNTTPDDDEDEDEDEDDEDDWGEMVSSPQVETHPSIEQIISAAPPPEKSISLQQQPQQPQQLRQDLPAVMSNPTSPGAVAVAADSWGAFADLSAFEEEKVKEAPPPVVGGSSVAVVEELITEPVVVPSAGVEISPDVAKVDVSIPTSPPVLSPVQQNFEAPSPKAVLGPIEETGSNSGNREQEEGEVVRRIVQGLPDLTYMLR